jgi:hypothetical protein
MKPLAKEILRWAAIVASGGCGLWILAPTGLSVLRWNGGWFSFLILFLSLVFAAPCFAVACICWRRQYRKLFMVLGVVGSIAVFGECLLLPGQFGIYEFFGSHARENPAIGILGLPLSLLFLFGPAYAAGWFFDLCHRLAYPRPPWCKRPKTQSTRWLVWSGAGLILLFLAIGTITMLTAALSAEKSPSHAASSELFDNLFLWFGELPFLAMLLMFIGLVRRQPIPETSEESVSPEGEPTAESISAVAQ